MAKNPFTALQDYVDKPKRNTFDLSFQNNLTMRFGKLYPVFCKEVVPGDSFRIEPTFGLRFMPLVFPVQTRMQANLHFFYVRNRNLWKDWPDFIGRTKSGLIPPYLSPSTIANVAKTKGLADYLGVPTTLVGSYGGIVSDGTSSLQYYADLGSSHQYRNYSIGGSYNLSVDRTKYQIQSGFYDDLYGVFSRPITSYPRVENGRLLLRFTTSEIQFTNINSDSNGYRLALYWRVGDDYRPVGSRLLLANRVAGDSYEDAERALITSGNESVYASEDALEGVGYFVWNLNVSGSYFEPYDSSFVSFTDLTLPDLISFCHDKFGNLDYRLCLFALGDSSVETASLFSPTFEANPFNTIHSVDDFVFPIVREGVTDINDLDNNPYLSGDIRISALPFRAYESIYNAFYRNQFNDPFKINGVVEYNKFITTNEGGEDRTVYDLFNRNYEMDFLTSAKQSPVDGDITPLVGVSGTGEFTFKNADDTTYTVTPIVGEDGHTLTGIQSVEGSPENNSGIRRLTDMISVGISINDFRNVNALQRWLETNLRRGYRYKDQIMSHFGVEVRYDELDMPEFIGGMSEPVLVNQVSQTVDATDSPSGLGDFSKVLGSFAGQASVLASSNHAIDKYCDEHGFILGILSITPVPNYSQLLPKMFVKDNVLDYYFPEFGHIGNQPIPYREVVPLQSYAEGDSLNDVFGYQRAWYDYLASVDEVHGDFRTSLDGFLINRVFDSRPELGKSFIEVDDTAMSNPFSVTGDEDKILGQIYFKVTAQRPIPKLGIPRLE